MPKLILINPVEKKSGYLLSSFSTFAPLGLGYLAGVTPPHWEVVLKDENFEPCGFEPADLVGITGFTSSINRAYELARIFRSRGVPVVIGGIHASMVPREVEEYADSVVIGEGEAVWPRLLADFEADRLLPVYHGSRLDGDTPWPRPRRELFHPGYLWQSIQTSRGCPFDCTFCSVTRYLGKEYRQRSAADVLSELETIPGRYVAFVDDNLIGTTAASRERAKAIFRGMIDGGMKKLWWMQTSINAAEDPEVLDLAARAGCLFAFVGFETIDEAGLKQMHKGVNLKLGVGHYKKAVQAFHRRGIGVMGGFIVGNDFESPSYYRRFARYLLHSGIDICQISILTPLPGTQFFEVMEREDRLVDTDFPGDWRKYRLSRIVHRPAGISAEGIYRGDNYIKTRLYGPLPFFYRMVRSFLSLRKIRSFYGVYRFNRALHRSWQNSFYYQNFPATLEDDRPLTVPAGVAGGRN